MTKQQFDLSDLQVADDLQGVKLASFSSRVIAYTLDWMIVFLAAKFFYIAILIVFIFLIVKKRAKSTITQGTTLIDSSLNKVNERLEKYEVNYTIRKKFHAYMKAYVRILIFVVFFVSIILALTTIYGFLFPAELTAMLEGTKTSSLMQLLETILEKFKLFFGAIGGLFYFSMFTWKWAGQTPGKRLLKIKVVKLNGKPITLWNSFERVSGYTASASLLFIGFFQYFWDKNHQTTHDKIYRTIVISIKQIPETDS
ncbi:MAG: RDD family protein [Bacteroidia bacterium]|nr:RDD family protein [Bacteroidia bacterium]